MKQFLAFILGLLPLCTQAACIVKDDAGNSLRLIYPAKRVISLAPDITETLFAIGAGKQVVAVMGGSDYPAAARQLPVIGSYHGVDLERVVSLKPDLIVTWSSTFSRQLKVLKESGIPIYTVEPRRLQDIPRTMRQLGCLTGTEKSADQAAQHFSQRLDQLYKQYHDQKLVTVFYQIGAYSLMTINKDSWINQVLVLCGGQNVFADAKTIAPEVSWEAVIMRNPDVIMNGIVGNEWKQPWQRWTELTAVKHQFLFSVHPDLIHRAGPRLVEGVTQVCQDLQKTRT